MKMHRKKFTLIELLVVIAIISVLIALSIAGLLGVREKARGANSRTRAHDMVVGIQAFMQSYRYLPAPNSSEDTIYNQKSSEQTTFYNIMSGDASGKKFNPKKHNFFNPTKEDKLAGKYLDAWGMPFYICLDTNYDGAINMPKFTNVNENHILKEEAAVFSIGDIAAGELDENNPAHRGKMRNFSPSW